MPSFQLSKRFKTRHRQSGISLILLIFLIGLAATGFAVRSLSSGSVQIQRNVDSVKVLEEAKAAVIGRVITQSGNNIGQFPCPEDTGLIGGNTEGQTKSSCSNTALSIGRFAWRTMGTGDIRDGNNDNLWYALSPGFQSIPVNSDSVAGLSVDGIANQAIAMLFSPGTALSSQTRSSFSALGGPNVANYLDGSNNDDSDSLHTFITGTASTTFNDKSVAIKPDDIFPVLEKQVLNNIKNYLVAYKSTWGAYPYPAAFSNPTTASFVGVAGNTGGWLPIADAGLSWGGDSTFSQPYSTGSYSFTSRCAVSGAKLVCTIPNQNYSGSRYLFISVPVNKLALGFYTPLSVSSTSDFTVSPASLRSQLTLTQTLNSSGSGTMTLQGSSGGLVNVNTPTYTITFNYLPKWVDWSTTAAIPNYIYKNNWQQLIYYKLASPFLPGGTGLCGSCLTVNKINVTPNTTQSNVGALLVSAGRKLASPAQTRPGSALTDYFEPPNNSTAGQVFDTTNFPQATFNDQVEVVEQQP